MRTGYGSMGTYGCDGVGGTTVFVDPARGIIGLFVAQILPWPEDMHARFRTGVYAALER